MFNSCNDIRPEKLSLSWMVLDERLMGKMPRRIQSGERELRRPLIIMKTRETKGEGTDERQRGGALRQSLYGCLGEAERPRQEQSNSAVGKTANRKIYGGFQGSRNEIKKGEGLGKKILLMLGAKNGAPANRDDGGVIPSDEPAEPRMVFPPSVKRDFTPPCPHLLRRRD